MPRVKNWINEWEEIAAMSRKLAKRANQRLVRLEQYSKREGLSEIKKFAYKKAIKYISQTFKPTKSGKLRYKENVKLDQTLERDGKKLSGDDLYRENVRIQKARIKAMEEFLSSDTSTLGTSRSGPKTQGIKNIYDKRTQTINEKFLKEYGLELTDEDLKRFFESKKQAKLETQVGSSRMFVVAAVMKKYNLKTNKRELEKFFKEHIELDSLHYDGWDEDYLKTRKGEGYKDYVERLRDYVDYTGDEILDDYITKALKAGINVNNIFI